MSSDRREKLNRLLAALAEGEADCLDGIFGEAGGQMLAVALGILRDRALAEDAVHDSLIKIALNARKYKRNTSALAWIMTVVRNTALDSLRRRKREISVDEIFPLTSYNYSIDSRENALTLESAVKSLEPDEQRIIYCRYYLDMTVREAAAALKISRSAAQRIQDRAEEKIKDILSGTKGGPQTFQ